MPSIVMKHTATDAHNCEIEWNADFGKMKLTLQAGFVSPRLLHDFLWQLPHKDDRFVRTGIIGAVQITKRFDTRLELPSGTMFKVHAYQPAPVGGVPQEPQLEFFEVASDQPDQAAG
ncbi:MAG TPA: hypothetical protein VFF26_05375 [Gallionella sp.]|nr:hypothetical protein [Gallionella sp.]